MNSTDPYKIASQCRHYAMCKIDFLGTGICPPAPKKHYVSYFPQGRMDIYAALIERRIPVTERLIDIADSCTLCGICDKQCYFVTELRPGKVMAALKEYVTLYLKNGQPIARIEPDGFLNALQAIMGKEWASSDPAILAAYAHDPGPFTGFQMPGYVALPCSTEEVSRTIKLCNDQGLNYAVRGNGSSVMGFVFSEGGLVLDMRRMQEIRIDTANWKASVGAGVSAFDLQKQAAQHGLRANVAEPAALVCANIMCSGIFSTYSNAYGTAADNYVSAEFVDPEGRIFNLDERDAPNLFGFQLKEQPVPGICTRADIRLHPKTDDEAGMLVPCSNFRDAVSLARNLAQRRIGLALAVLGLEYISTFISSTAEVARKVKTAFKKDLGIEYAVLVIGDTYARKSVEGIVGSVMDTAMLSSLILGIPNLVEDEWLSMLQNGEGSRRPYELLLSREMLPLWEAALRPSPDTVAGSVEEDLQDFYRELYARPEMSDLVWLNDFRIISSRMGREKHVVAFIIYVPLDNLDTIEHINSEFERIAAENSIKNDYGFLTPLDLGKRAVLEYDYYMNQTDPKERENMQKAVMEAGAMLERAMQKFPGVLWIKYVFNQGFARKESFLYR